MQQSAALLVPYMLFQPHQLPGLILLKISSFSGGRRRRLLFRHQMSQPGPLRPMSLQPGIAVKHFLARRAGFKKRRKPSWWNRGMCGIGRHSQRVKRGLPSRTKVSGGAVQRNVNNKWCNQLECGTATPWTHSTTLHIPTMSFVPGEVVPDGDLILIVYVHG